MPIIEIGKNCAVVLRWILRSPFQTLNGPISTRDTCTISHTGSGSTRTPNSLSILQPYISHAAKHCISLEALSTHRHHESRYPLTLRMRLLQLSAWLHSFSSNNLGPCYSTWRRHTSLGASYLVISFAHRMFNIISSPLKACVSCLAVKPGSVCEFQLLSPGGQDEVRSQVS